VTTSDVSPKEELAAKPAVKALTGWAHGAVVVRRGSVWPADHPIVARWPENFCPVTATRSKEARANRARLDALRAPRPARPVDVLDAMSGGPR
jgi:hypothetical protein